MRPVLNEQAWYRGSDVEQRINRYAAEHVSEDTGRRLDAIIQDRSLIQNLREWSFNFSA